ncbi:hypothetical protein MPH_10893 [Macrophomina phaseolina MS6]|uniref:Uncharacterized protein n=1 Tax=Macrophomina phaseolina (strain MS6) TaxID=1126212 RepID=K2RBS3_MACPH|nr:hypothetical protein MPH_10893 [Macrophomina phaseolina MS6]
MSRVSLASSNPKAPREGCLCVFEQLGGGDVGSISVLTPGWSEHGDPAEEHGGGRGACLCPRARHEAGEGGHENSLADGTGDEPGAAAQFLHEGHAHEVGDGEDGGCNGRKSRRGRGWQTNVAGKCQKWAFWWLSVRTYVWKMVVM